MQGQIETKKYFSPKREVLLLFEKGSADDMSLLLAENRRFYPEAKNYLVPFLFKFYAVVNNNAKQQKMYHLSLTALTTKEQVEATF